MASKNNDNPAPTTANNVRRFLSQKSPDTLNRWLEEAEPDSAHGLLYEVAETAWRPDYFSLILFGSGFLGMIACAFLHVKIHPGTFAFLSYLLASIFAYNICRAGAKAAVLMAERNIEGFLSPMARTWSPWDKKPLLTAIGQANFERRLAAAHAQPDPSLIKALRGMLDRAFPWRLRRSRHDFTEVQADILLAALRCVAKAGGDKNEKVLRRIAHFPVPANASNRALIQAIAQTFLLPETPMIPLERPTSSVVAETPQTISLRRRV